MSARSTEFYRLFARTEKTLTIFSQGVNQSSAGTDKVNSIINCHLLTGRIGRPGMGPFSVTGQPNAMGGREVGGLATTLAAHMDLEIADHRRIVQEFWNSPRHRERAGAESGRPVRRHPRRPCQSRVDHGDQSDRQPAGRRPRKRSVATLRAGGRFGLRPAHRHDRARARPAARRRLGREGRHRHQFRSTHLATARLSASCPAKRKPDWWIISQVARRLGYAPAFAFETRARDLRGARRACPARENDGRRAFDISGLSSLSRRRLRSAQLRFNGRFPLRATRAPNDC